MYFHSRDQIEAALRAEKLDPLVKEILGAVRPTVAFMKAGEGKPDLGASRLGGRPDVPAGFEWPTYRSWDGETRLLPFLAQINFADISAAHLGLEWPTAGNVLVFYSLEHSDGAGDYSGDGNSGLRLFYTTSSLSPASQLAGYGDTESRALSNCRGQYLSKPLSAWRLPNHETIIPRAPGDLDDHRVREMEMMLMRGSDPLQDVRDHWSEIAQEFEIGDWRGDEARDIDEAPARLGGWATAVQDEQVSRVSDLDACWNAKRSTQQEYNDAVKYWGVERASRHDLGWRLLLQVPTSDFAVINIYIQASDLIARRFDRCWAIYVGS